MMTMALKLGEFLCVVFVGLTLINDVASFQPLRSLHRRVASHTTTTSNAAVSKSQEASSSFGALKVGIIRLDGWGNQRSTGTGDTSYVPIKGDVDDAQSFAGQPFGLVASIAQDCTWDALKDPNAWNDQQHLEEIQKGAAKSFKTLLDQRCDVIISNCGLFMWLHAKGLVVPAMQQAFAQLASEGKPADSLFYPIVSLSTLTTLTGYLPLFGLGEVQREVIQESQNPASHAVIPIFTSDGDACLAILRATQQLNGTNFFVHDDPPEKKNKGGILVVGLNGPNVVGTGPVNGFEIVNDGTPAFYDILNPSIQKVAEAVKENYPNTAMAIVECTEVGAYTDTIRSVLQVPVLDPILLATRHMETFIDHGYKQLDHWERQIYIRAVQAVPIKVDTWLPYYIEIGQFYDTKHNQHLANVDGKNNTEIQSLLIKIAKEMKRVSDGKRSKRQSTQGMSSRDLDEHRYLQVMEHAFRNADPANLKALLQSAAGSSSFAASSLKSSLKQGLKPLLDDKIKTAMLENLLKSE